MKRRHLDGPLTDEELDEYQRARRERHERLGLPTSIDDPVVLDRIAGIVARHKAEVARDAQGAA